MKDSQPLNRDMVYVLKYIKVNNERFSTTTSPDVTKV